MAYITRANIEAIYGPERLAILLPEGVDPDVAIEAAAEIASSEADLFLCKSYTVPLAEVPAGLRAAIIDRALYRLAATHDRLSEELTQRGKDAMALFKAISKDDAGLGTAEPASAPAAEPAGENGASSPDGAFFAARPRLFGR